MFRDRDGERIDLLRWAELFEDMEYRRLGWTELPDGRVISTVWMGLDIDMFSTGVFASPRPGFETVARYDTEAAALEGHERVVAQQRKAGRCGPPCARGR